MASEHDDIKTNETVELNKEESNTNTEAGEVVKLSENLEKIQINQDEVTHEATEAVEATETVAVTEQSKEVTNTDTLESNHEDVDVEEEEEEEEVGDVEKQDTVDKVQGEEPTNLEEPVKKGPAFIPRKGYFYEHDDRLGDEEAVVGAAKDIKETTAAAAHVKQQDTVNNKPQKKRGPDGDRWSHDRFNEHDQQPKATRDLIRVYGYDIRKNNPKTLDIVNDTTATSNTKTTAPSAAQQQKKKQTLKSDKLELDDYVKPQQKPKVNRNAQEQPQQQQQRNSSSNNSNSRPTSAKSQQNTSREAQNTKSKSVYDDYVLENNNKQQQPATNSMGSSSSNSGGVRQSESFTNRRTMNNGRTGGVGGNGSSRGGRYDSQRPKSGHYDDYNNEQAFPQHYHTAGHKQQPQHHQYTNQSSNRPRRNDFNEYHEEPKQQERLNRNDNNRGFQQDVPKRYSSMRSQRPQNSSHDEASSQNMIKEEQNANYGPQPQQQQQQQAVLKSPPQNKAMVQPQPYMNQRSQYYEPPQQHWQMSSPTASTHGRPLVGATQVHIQYNTAQLAHHLINTSVTPPGLTVATPPPQLIQAPYYGFNYIPAEYAGHAYVAATVTPPAQSTGQIFYPPHTPPHTMSQHQQQQQPLQQRQSKAIPIVNPETLDRN